MYKRDVTVLNAAHLIMMGVAKSTGKWSLVSSPDPTLEEEKVGSGDETSIKVDMHSAV